jgi:hypothetical protein
MTTACWSNMVAPPIGAFTTSATASSSISRTTPKMTGRPPSAAAEARFDMIDMRASKRWRKQSASDEKPSGI